MNGDGEDEKPMDEIWGCGGFISLSHEGRSAFLPLWQAGGAGRRATANAKSPGKHVQFRFAI